MGWKDGDANRDKVHTKGLSQNEHRDAEDTVSNQEALACNKIETE